MKKTLLLVYIHGFKVRYLFAFGRSMSNALCQGDDNTFGDFPNHLSRLVQNALPKIEVRSRVYPQFETRGDLTECVSRFQDW